MKLRTLAIVLVLCMVMGMTAFAAENETANNDDVYEQMKEVYTKAGVGLDQKEEFYYILAYDDNVDNAIFILMDKEGKESFNVVGKVTEEDSWLTIEDQTDKTTVSFGIKDLTEEGFTMVMQKNNEEIPMKFCDAAQVVDLIKAIDTETNVVNPFADGEQKTEEKK